MRILNKIKKDLNLMSINNKSKSYYLNEGKKILKKYNIKDKNFKYLLLELINYSKYTLEIDSMRDIIVILQKHVCLEYNKRYKVEDY